MNSSRGRFFYGWYIVAAMFAVMVLGFGGAFYLFGVFLPVLTEEFGWSRTQLSGSQSAALILMAVTGPFVGRIVDRWGARRVLAVGALLCTTGFVSLGRVGTVVAVNRLLAPLTQFYLAYLVFALGLTCIGFIPVNTVIATWFNKRRGLAMGIAITGIGFGGSIMVPLAGYLIDNFGWRQAYTWLGLLISLIILPTVALVVKRSPASMGLEPDGEIISQERGPEPPPEPEEAPHFQLSRLLRSAPFRAQALACAFYNLGTMTVLVHGISLLQERGIEPQNARLMISAMALLGICGKVVFGYLADRLSIQRLSAWLYVLQAGGILLLVLVHSPTTGWLFAIVAGLSMGGVVTLQPLLVGAYFGVRAFGSIYGVLHIMMAGAAAIGPIVAAYLYDVGGGYEPALLAFVAANALGGILILWQQDPRNYQWP